MKGLLTFKIKMPGDPARNFPVKVAIEVKRGEIKTEDIRKILNLIHQEGAHLVLVLTDHTPSPEVLEELESIPQIILRVIEHRDLVKLLVISLAKQHGIDIDKTLLSRAYTYISEKIGLRESIERWFEMMTKKGYMLNFEGFVDKTVKAGRFFINSTGKKLSLEECYQWNWNIRNFLPFGIVSEIIPDISLGELKNYTRILKDCGFLEEDQEKHYIKTHPSERQVIEILERYGGSTSEYILKQHFVFRETTEHIFDSLLEHMERRMLIAHEHNTVRLIKLQNIRRLREEAVEKFEQDKRKLRTNDALSFATILTWKENNWHLISLERMEKTIENLLEEAALASDEEEVRSRTFLIEEMVKWYETYVDIILLSKFRTDKIIESLEREIEDIEQRCNAIFDKLMKCMEITGLQIKLDEAQKLRSEMDEIKHFIKTQEGMNDLEKMLGPLVGGKRVEREIRRERLATDIDDEIDKRKIRGDWTVAKYLLVKKIENKMINEINDLRGIVDSLDSLTDKLRTIVGTMSNLLEMV